MQLMGSPEDKVDSHETDRPPLTSWEQAHKSEPGEISGTRGSWPKIVSLLASISANIFPI
jgi:hypothetical protein